LAMELRLGIDGGPEACVLPRPRHLRHDGMRGKKCKERRIEGGGLLHLRQVT